MLIKIYNFFNWKLSIVKFITVYKLIAIDIWFEKWLNILGIRNVLVLFCAVMTEHKILFHSSSYSRLTEGCRALTALMYPFKYTHVNIPLLPAALIDFLDTPTPFIMGVHSSLKHEVAELVSIFLEILYYM